MNGIYTALVSSILVFGSGAAGLADSAQLPPQLSVQAGAFIPSQSNAAIRGSIGHVTARVGYQFYTFTGSDYDSTIRASVNLEYVAPAGGLTMLPITIGATSSTPSQPTNRCTPYEGAQIGDYLVTVGTKHKQLLGGYGFVGLNFGSKQDTFLEAGYHFVSRFDGNSLDGLELSVGVRR